MATRDAARVLGREAELGTLEPGKLADLVVVDADPLADLRNLAEIHAVMKDGQVYFPTEMIGKYERPRPGKRRQMKHLDFELL